jgi:NADH dehydrogenase
VVIVGGGFGGLACARKLDGKPVDVLLVDARNYHLFTPLLYQVATALLNPSDVAYPLRAVFRHSQNVRFCQARVLDVDFEGKRIRLHDGTAIPYDHLVLAAGSTNNYFGQPDLARHTIGLKTIEEALRLRGHVLACLELASRERDEAERRRLLTFVVVGGGPTGVEYAGALEELLRIVLGRDYPDLSPALKRIVLVEGRDRLLEAFPERLSRYAERTLSRREVEVRTGSFLTRAEAKRVFLSDGAEIQTRTVVWSAGVRPNDLPGTRGMERSRTQRLEVDEHLRLSGRPGVFAIGDLASLAEEGQELPMLSPFAMQGGRHVAQVILQETQRDGGPVDAKPFRYVDKGTMATIGRNAAVGQIRSLRFTGFIGWVAWLVVHIYYLIGFRNRAAVLMQWGWNYLRKDRPIRIIAKADDDELTADLTGKQAPVTGEGSA